MNMHVHQSIFGNWNTPVLYHEPAWVTQIFNSDQARSGGVVRRSVASVHRYAGHRKLVAAVRRRGFHMSIEGRQYVINCNDGHKQTIM
ncbi:hypothetical protein J2X48_002489 [Bosea sp. BE271]|uniref:hypothetical protein n=1 Tax=Bosea TaxID=85413 RepID=UPI002860BEE0|nr:MULTISPECIES: hypothetical protein [Bosea]MDR6830803.1 hypothetical protein [Bosea robiniae]MDR6895460.1 hypothetical protein [Bosea sp. BE109]MDR7138856.1 hypothetical protein [Bosea sp. BE168]MDR7175557.1 hypothetical protein [Bosea sp. BE271]